MAKHEQSFNLIGGYAIPNTKELECLGILKLIFEKDGEYYTQSPSPVKNYHFTFTQDANFNKYNTKAIQEIIEHNNKDFKYIAFSKDFIRNNNMDYSKMIYALAVTPSNIIIGNLHDFCDQIKDLKMKDAYIHTVKKQFLELAKQEKEWGFSTTDKYMAEYIRRSQELNSTLEKTLVRK